MSQQKFFGPFGIRGPSPNAFITPPRRHLDFNRFYLDFSTHVGAFFTTFDAVVNTCFVDLELAPPSNRGNRFPSFKGCGGYATRPQWLLRSTCSKPCKSFRCETNISDMCFASKNIHFPNIIPSMLLFFC